jgi:hypothetical protein
MNFVHVGTGDPQKPVGVRRCRYQNQNGFRSYHHPEVGADDFDLAGSEDIQSRIWRYLHCAAKALHASQSSEAHAVVNSS